MKRVAVIAHSGKTFGGGLPELRRVLERRGVRDVRWREVGRAARRPSRCAKARRAEADLIFVWGGDGMVQRCVDALAGSARRSRSSRPGPRTCWRRTSASRRTSSRRWTSGWAATRRRIDVGRINGERFAVMAGAGLRRADDRRRRRRAEGPPRAARLHLDGRKQPAREAVRARRSRSTARAGTTARRAASWSATSASCSPASRCSRTRSPTTACSRSASSRPTACAVGADDRRAVVGNAEQVAARLDHEGAHRPDQARPEGAATRSTAATARRSASCASSVEPGAVEICVPQAAARRVREIGLVQRVERPGRHRLGRAAPDGHVRAALVELDDGDGVVEGRAGETMRQSTSGADARGRRAPARGDDARRRVCRAP